MRQFASGSTRDDDADKLDFEAFLSPLALRRYAEYMHANRKLPDGTLRAGDNWQQGIPQDVYMKSLIRHVFAVWDVHRGYRHPEEMENDLCGVVFNTMGLLHEVLKEKL
jgi:hypothetical protein